MKRFASLLDQPLLLGVFTVRAVVKAQEEQKETTWNKMKIGFYFTGGVSTHVLLARFTRLPLVEGANEDIWFVFSAAQF